MGSKRYISSLEVEVVEEMDKYELCLHNCHIFSNTASWTCRERNKTVRLFGVFSRLGPTIGIKYLRIFVVFRVLHQSENIRTHQWPLFDRERTYLQINFSHSRKVSSRWRPHPQNLIDEMISKLHFLHIIIRTPRF